MNLSKLTVLRHRSDVYPNRGHDATHVLVGADEELHQVAHPCLRWRFDSADTGLISGLSGKRQGFLVVRHDDLAGFVVLVGAQTLGTALQTSWLLAADTRSTRFVSAFDELVDAPVLGLQPELDILDTIALSGMADVTRLALRNAVASLDDPNDDPDEHAVAPDEP